MPGFRTFVQTGIVLQVGSNPVINVVLEVGQVTEQVEVQANAAMVETRSVSVGQIMETERIMELPLNGRNAQELLLLAGAAVQVTPAAVAEFPRQVDDLERRRLGLATEYTLDGIRHVDSYDGYPLPASISRCAGGVQDGDRWTVGSAGARIPVERSDQVGHE